MVVSGAYSHVPPGSFSPSMAQPLRGWSAPRGGARPSGGVLLELGVQRQHRDPSAPLLKGGKQKRLRCHRGFGELPPFTHGLSLSKLLGGYLLVTRARSHPHWRSSVPLGSLVETAPIIPPACLKPGEACNTFALGVESVRCEGKSQKSLPCQASLEIGYCSDTDVARLCHYRSAEMWY
jgi:hypothetical protein